MSSLLYLFWVGIVVELAHTLHQDLIPQLLPLDAQLDNLLDDADLHGLLVLPS